MAKNQKILLWSLVLTGVLLLSVPYLVPHSGLLMLMALLPLLQIHKLSRKYSVKRVWVYYYSMFFLWNLFTTYWIYKATLPGAIAAIVLNSLQMALIFGAYRWFEKRTNKSLSYIFLILAWLAWEHFYFEAEISWPWLTLGNGLASTHKNIQWYEFTGTLGGSLWILVTNIMIFEFTGIIGRFSKLAGFTKENSKNISEDICNKNVGSKKSTRTGKDLILFLITLFVIHFPFIYSQIMYRSYKEQINPKEFVVVQH
jgi:apolipoprotein N-acyltransferase